MDELAALISKLEGEVAALEAAVDGRKADEASQLGVHERRLADADQRLTRARAMLSADGAALAALDERRAHLLQRIDSWRGQLWRMGHGTAVMALFVAALHPLPVISTWLGSSWAITLACAQAAAFAAAFFLIPEKR